MIKAVKKLRIVLLAAGCIFAASPAWAQPSLDFSKMIKPVPAASVLQDPDYFTWGASAVKCPDGLYHLFYSRWERRLGHNAWVTHSEIAHAVSSNPGGPYVFKDLALPPRGAEFWDGLCTHNPTVHQYGNKFYLYYMGNTGDGKAMDSLNPVHRNNQRIGVAVADNPNGPWKRLDKPLIDVSPEADAYDALMVSNPSVTRRPNGSFLMIYKAVGKKIPGVFGGPVVHLAAVSSSPAGPFKKIMKPIFTAEKSAFPAEDPYIWFQGGRYWAILKDMHGAFTSAGQALVLFESKNGFDWKLAEHPLVSKLEIKWADGTVQKVAHLERPQLLFDKKGRPIVLFLAADVDREHSFNVAVPLASGRCTKKSK